MEGVPCVDEVGRLGAVLVGEEAALDADDVPDSEARGRRAQRLDHRGRDVHRHDATTERRDREREDAGSGAEVDHARIRVESEPSKESDVVGGIYARLALVVRDVGGVEVLRAG
jgi:hypothetical protein